MSKNKKVGAYKRGLYQAALGFIRTKQVVTRSMVEKFYTDAGKSEAAASASATVLLSPRKEDSKRGKFGNCLGNYSADGAHYFMVPLKHVKGEEKKFRFLIDLNNKLVKLFLNLAIQSLICLNLLEIQ